MKYSWIYSNKSIIKFILFLGLLGLVLGFIIYYRESESIKEGIVNYISSFKENNDSRGNMILLHLVILSLLIVLSLVIVGLPLCLIYYFYEFVSIGYLYGSLFSYKGFSGVLFGLIFTIINKMIFLSVLNYFLIVMINYIKRLIINLRRGEKDIIIRYLYKCIIILFVVFINDILVYYLGNILSKGFIFLL